MLSLTVNCQLLSHCPGQTFHTTAGCALDSILEPPLDTSTEVTADNENNLSMVSGQYVWTLIGQSTEIQTTNVIVLFVPTITVYCVQLVLMLQEQTGYPSQDIERTGVVIIKFLLQHMSETRWYHVTARASNWWSVASDTCTWWLLFNIKHILHFISDRLLWPGGGMGSILIREP